MTELEWRQRFGAHLQDILNERDVSAYRASLDLGWGKTTIYYLIDGEHSISAFKAVQLAEYLGVSLDELLDV